MHTTKRTLYDGDTFERFGYTFTFRTEPDSNMGEPWKEHDGHGIVSAWTTRGKRPGEVVIASDRSSRRYYDVQASTTIARRDGWGCGDVTHTHATKREQAACAVSRDCERLRQWCDDYWSWIGVIVEYRDDDGAVLDHASLWGIESDAGDYLRVVAEELADEIVGRLEVENPDIVLSEN